MKHLLIALIIALGLFAALRADAPTAEQRTRVVIIDTGITPTPKLSPFLCLDGHRDFTNTDGQDRMAHGTNVANVLSEHLDHKTHCIVSYKWYDTHTIKGAMSEAIIAASFKKDLKYINLSAGGVGPSISEYIAFKYALAKGVSIAVAAGNEHANLDYFCLYYPACYDFTNKRFHVVGATDFDGSMAWWSNFGKRVTDWGQGYVLDITGQYLIAGTSFATPNVLGQLIKKESQSPSDSHKALQPMHTNFRFPSIKRNSGQ